MSHYAPDLVEPRFWAKVQKGTDCWVWIGACSSFGYGSLSIKGAKKVAHRFAWERANGPIPAGLYVLHRCDNPRCVRVEHLFLGSKAENTADKIAKGRGGNFRREAMSVHSLRYRGRSVSERFWLKVKKSAGCWEWCGAGSAKGPGNFNPGGRTVSAHRFSWELHYGRVDDGLWVLHKCDNPRCVRPDHLFLGTAQDNVDDMYSKQRAIVGSAHARAKLTESDVREIRRAHGDGVQQKLLAARFGVCKQVVNRIVHREDWKHVT